MKRLFIGLILIFSIISEVSGQKKTVDISSNKIAQLNGKYSKVINLETNDTTYYLYLGFQNAKYSAITDIKSIFLTNQGDLDMFLKDLKTALPEMGKKTTLNWSRSEYNLSLYDFTPNLYLNESPSKGSGYTMLNKKSVEKLIAWFETIKFGKG